MVGGDGVEDEVEAASVLRHFVGVGGDHHFVRAQPEGVLLLARRSGENHHVSAESASELHGHVSEPAQSHDAGLLPCPDVPVPQRRPGCDARAEQRRGGGRIQISGNAQDEILVHDDPFRIAAVGHAAEMAVGEVVGTGHCRAELLEPAAAVGAGAAGVHHAPDANEVAGAELRCLRPGSRDPAHDLVPGDARVDRGRQAAPLIPHRVQVTVADAAAENLDLDVPPLRLAPRNGGGGQRRVSASGSIGFHGWHGCCLLSLGRSTRLRGIRAAGFFRSIRFRRERSACGSCGGLRRVIPREAAPALRAPAGAAKGL